MDCFVGLPLKGGALCSTLRAALLCPAGAWRLESGASWLEVRVHWKLSLELRALVQAAPFARAADVTISPNNKCTGWDAYWLNGRWSL